MSWLPIDGHAHQELQTKAVFFTSFGLRPHQGTYFEVQDLPTRGRERRITT